MMAYYVYAPRYVPTSAGIRALYELVSDLRAMGQLAWIVTYSGHDQNQLDPAYADLVLPYEMALYHRYANLEPIVVYSETVHGNPLNADAVVRYIMNVPGLLGGPPSYASSDCLYAFSETLAERIDKPDWSLFIPLVDETKFTPGNYRRTINCVYASKYRHVHNCMPSDFPAGAVEISRDLQDSPDGDALLELLRKSKTVYVYENTAVAIEAVLCGALVVFKPNAYLEFSIGDKDHGNAGMAWGDDGKEIARAKKSLPRFREAWMECRARYPERLKLFIARTRHYRSQVSGKNMDWAIIKPPDYSSRAGLAAHRMLVASSPLAIAWKALSVLLRRGPLTFVRIVLSVLKTGRQS